VSLAILLLLHKIPKKAIFLDPIENPYSPGAGSPPPELAGRDRIREQVRIAIARIRVGNAAKSVLMGYGNDSIQTWPYRHN
jgi:hypothetical protein